MFNALSTLQVYVGHVSNAKNAFSIRLLQTRSWPLIRWRLRSIVLGMAWQGGGGLCHLSSLVLKLDIRPNVSSRSVQV